MKKIIIAGLLMVGLLLTSCVSKSPYIVDHPEFTEDGSPYWTVLTPLSKDRFYGVGVGDLSTVQNSKLRAEALAKDEIARQVSTLVQGAVNNYFNDSGFASNTQSLQAFESFSSQVTNSTLRSVIVENNWRNPDTGELWVIASYEKSNLKEAYRLEAENMKRSLEKRKISALEAVEELKIKNEEQKIKNKENKEALSALESAYKSLLIEKQQALELADSAVEAVKISLMLDEYNKEFDIMQNQIK